MANCVAHCKITGANRVSTARIEKILNTIVPEANRMIAEKRTDSVIVAEECTCTISTFFRENSSDDESAGQPFEVTVEWNEIAFGMELSVMPFKVKPDAPTPPTFHWKVVRDKTQSIVGDLKRDYDNLP